MQKRKKQKFVSFFSSLIFFTMLSKSAQSLPQDFEVVAGDTRVQIIDSKSMQIETSDKAIIHHKSFDIGKQEKVTFVQPSSSSSVLNKVVGGKPSEILGRLESNGKVFLVNPQGIYFGKDCSVNVGSLIASTLDISNEDFINENYQFFLGSHKNGLIQNEGFLSSSTEGSIVLMAPTIRNLGVIQAKAGQVVLLSGEHVTLDFSGDGLIRFSVEGEVKEALIENLGSIDAAGGSIRMKLSVAKKAIQEIVNQDGVEEGEVFIEKNGIIQLVPASSLISQNVSIDGADLIIQGSIDATNLEGLGGTVHLFGERISLLGADIDASGALGGGEVLIGGEFQGGGTTPWSSLVFVDESSRISASALDSGNGGLVVLWSQDQTLFNGSIFSKGGVLGGNGGLVETSSKGALGSNGRVDTSAVLGQLGDWLLDPDILNISDGGKPYSTCHRNDVCNAFEDVNLSCSNHSTEDMCSALDQCDSNIKLYANVAINVNVSLTIASGGSINFSPCSAGSPIQVNLYGNINAHGGSVIFTEGAYPVLHKNVTVNGGGGGGTVTMNQVQSASPSYGLTITAGSTVNISTADVLGSNFFPNFISISSGGGVITTESETSIKTSGGNVVISGAILPQHDHYDLTINAGAGVVSVTSIGNRDEKNRYEDVSITGSSVSMNFLQTDGSIEVIATGVVTIPSITSSSLIEGDAVSISGSSLSTQFLESAGSPITVSCPINLTGGDSIISSAVGSNAGADITVSTINGAQNLTLSGGTTGNVTVGAIGGSTPVLALTINQANGLRAQSISAASIYQAAGGSYDPTLNSKGGTVYGGTLTTTGAGGITLHGGTFTIHSVNEGGAGTGFLLENSGVCTIESDADITANGFFTQEGNSSAAPLGGGLFISGTATITSPVVSIAGFIQGPDTGGGVFTINNTSGLLTMTSGLRIRGGSFIQNGGSVTIGNDFTTTSAAFNGAGTFTTSSGSDIILTGDLTVAANTASLGGSLTANSATFTGTTLLETTSSAATIALTGALTASASSVSLRGTVTAASATFTGTTSLTTTSIALTGSLAAAANTVSLEGNFSAGSASFTGTTSLTTASGVSMTLTGALAAAANTVSLGGDFSAGSASFTGTTSLTTASGVSMTLTGSLAAAANTVSLGGNFSAGSASFTGTTSLTTASGVTMTLTGALAAAANQVSLGGSLSAGSASFTGLGSFTVQPATPSTQMTITDAFQANSFGSLSIGADILAGSISMSSLTPASLQTASPVTLTASVTWNTSAQNGTIKAGQIMSSGGAHYNFTLNAGSGVISVGNLGTGSSLANLTVLGTNLIQLFNITAEGVVAIHPNIELFGATTFISPTEIDLFSSVITSVSSNFLIQSTSGKVSIASIATDGGFLTIDTPVVTLNAAADIETSGGVITLPKVDGFQDLTLNAGAGSITVGNIGESTPVHNVSISGAAGFALPNITTKGGTITVNPSITLTGNRSLLTVGNNPDALDPGANITLVSTVDGAFELILDGGTLGNVALQAAVGGTTPLSDLIVKSVNTVTTQALSTSGSSGITIFSGLNSSINGVVTTTGGGGFTLSNTGDMTLGANMVLNGPFLQSGGGRLLTGSNITINGGSGTISAAGPVVLTGNVSWDTSATNGTITIEGSVTSPSTARTFTLNAGTGTISLEEALGTSIEGLGAVTMTAQKASIGSIYTKGASILITASMVTLNIDATLNTTVDSGSGASITLPTVDGFYNFTMNAGSSSISVGTIGGTTPLHNVTISSGSNFALPNITTSNGFIQINPSVLLGGDRTLSTSGGAIAFASTINGLFDLTLNPGSTGSIDLQGAVGGTTALDLLTITNALDVDTKAITAAGLVQDAGSGTTTFGGSLTIGSSGIDLTGSSFEFTAPVSSNSNVVIVNSESLILDLGADFTITGSFSQSGGGSTESAADIQTTSSITFTNQVILTGDVLLDSSPGNGAIVLQDSVASPNQPYFLDLDAGTGSVTLNGPLGGSLEGLDDVIITASTATFGSIYTEGGDILVLATSVELNATSVLDTTVNVSVGSDVTLPTVDGFQDLTINPGTGGTITVDTIGGLIALGDVTIFGTEEFICPNITTTSGTILIHPPAVLSSDTTLDTIDSRAGADIHFFSTIDGTTVGGEDLTLLTGVGTIQLDGDVGSLVRLGEFSIVSAFDVVTSEILATSIEQQSGTGTTTFGGVLNTTGASGIAVNGSHFIFKGDVTTGGVGSLQIIDSGSLLIESGVDMVLGGSFTQSGGGAVSTGGTIESVSSITFTDPVTLTSGVIWDSSLGDGAVLIKSTVNGTGGLTVDAGLGTVIFEKNIGATARLSSLSVEGASIVFKEPKVVTSGNQIYYSPVTLETNVAFSTLTGDITFVSTLDGNVDEINVGFSLGGGALTVNSLGSIHKMGGILALNSGLFSSQDITGDFLRVSGGKSRVELHGPIELSGFVGLVVDSGSLFLGNTIEARRLFFRTRGSIVNTSTPHLLTVLGGGAIGYDYIDALGGVIGSLESPVEVTTNGILFVGADPRADFSGPLPVVHFELIPNNQPCILTYNGEVLFDCAGTLTAQNLFNTVPKDLFYVPGIYSSWDNLSNEEYFIPEDSSPASSPRMRTMFWKRPEVIYESTAKKKLNLSEDKLKRLSKILKTEIHIK